MGMTFLGEELTDVEMIKNPEHWPQYPFLPVKKRNKVPGEFPEYGIIFVMNRTTVVKANLFDLPTTKEGFFELPNYKYPDVESLVADGWEVD